MKNFFITVCTAAALTLGAMAALPAARAAAEEPYKAVAAKLDQQKEMFKLKLPKWKFNKDMDERCIDPHFETKNWKSIGLGYMWPEFKSVWFRNVFKMPETVDGGRPVKGSKVILHVNMEQFGNIYVNGRHEQYFRRDQGEVVLTTSATPGEEYAIALEGINQRLTGMFLDAWVEFTALDELNRRSNDYLNMLRTVDYLLDTLPEADRAKWTKVLNDSTTLVDLAARDAGDEAKYFASLDKASALLLPFGEIARKNTVYLIGYSHIDLAWLWDKHEGEDVWKNTSVTMLKLMDEYPEFPYIAGQAAGYAWIENDYPEIWKQVLKSYKEGRWELTGGSWTEHDGNIPSGEAFVREYLYGKRYFREKFGKDVIVGWTPDSFGYNLGLPQILRKSGIKYYLTQKINWNDTTRFPYNIFWWEGPDGSRILTYFPVGGYGESLDSRDLLNQLKKVRATHGVPEDFAIFGVGDHGGGVTRTQLNRAFALRKNPVFPKVEFSFAEKYFDHLADLSKTTKFPVWNDELYLQYHRGTYTTQANTKRNNRWGEVLQENGEKLASIAWLFGTPYPSKRIRDGWNILMFNHFHDILPGSSIRPVYEDADSDYAQQQKILGDIIAESSSAIEQRINTQGKGAPLVLFNTLAWPRDAVVELPFTYTMPPNPAVLDQDGRPVPSQISIQNLPDKTLVFVAHGIPAGGYAVYRIVDAAGVQQPATEVAASGNSISNKYMKIEFDEKTGLLTSIKYLPTDRELAEPGKGANYLQAYDDRPKQYDAWEIALGEEIPFQTESEAQVIEAGPVRATVKFTRKVGNSPFTQYVSLYENMPLAEGRIETDWKENHVAIKLAFNLNLKSNSAWFDIPYSAIERYGVPRNDDDRAKHEVSGQKWVDYTDPAANFGVSLLNNSKYGYDIKNNVLRMTVVRAPTDPDPKADRHKHSIPYALYPHIGDWREAATPRRGFEFNYPLITRIAENHPGELPAALTFFSCEPANVILTVVKKAEDTDETVIRLFEATGKEASAVVLLPKDIEAALETNLLEEKPDWKTAPITISGKKLAVQMGKFEIKTIKVKFKK